MYLCRWWCFTASVLEESSKSPFGARPIWSSLFKYFSNRHFKVSKNSEKILDVDIYVLHSPANFQSEIVFTLTYTKMTNSVRSENFKPDTVHRLRSINLSFLHSSKYKIFRIGFLHAGRTDNCLQLYFFAEFFET